MIIPSNCRFLLFLAVFFMCVQGIQAQDTIVTVRKKKILAKVVEINYKDVLYKKFNNLTGPTYGIPRKDLLKIIYANGVIDTFNLKLIRIPEPVEVPPPPKKFDPRAEDYFRNFVHITASDLFMGLFSVGYERILKSGKTSIRIPVSFGMSGMGITKTKYDNTSPLASVLPSGAYYFSNKIFSTGLELNYFPRGQGTIKYFWGPAIAYGQYNFYQYKGVESLPGTFTIDKQSSAILTFMIKNGVIVQFSKKFNATAYFGLGLDNVLNKPKSSTNNNYYYSDNNLRYFTTELGINVGYKF